MPKNEFAALLRRTQIAARRAKAMSEDIQQCLVRPRMRPMGQARMPQRLRRAELRVITGGA